MMKTDDLEKKLQDLKRAHLTENEMAAYCNQQLATAARARADAHLKQCFLCTELLALRREEYDALNQDELSEADAALVEQLMAEGVPVQERLTEYLRPMVASWKTFFTRQARGATQSQAPRRVSGRGKEVWQWQSDDGLVRAEAKAETRSDLTIHFYSSEMMLEGASFQVRLGPVDEQVTFQRLSDSELYGKVAVPRQEPRRLAKLSIEASRTGDET